MQSAETVQSSLHIAALGVVFETDTDFGQVEYCPSTQGTQPLNDTRFEELDLSHLDIEKQTASRRLLHKYRALFDDKPGNANVAEHHIEVEPTYKLTMAHPYRIPDRLKAEVDRQVSGLIAVRWEN